MEVPSSQEIKKSIAVFSIGALAIVGFGEVVDYYSERAGIEAGNAFVQTVKEANMSDKIDQLKEEATNQFTREWVEGVLEEQQINSEWLLDYLTREDE